MFDKNIKIYGKYSDIIKKYSKDKQSSDQLKFTVTNNDGKTRDIYIFDTMIQCYMVAAMLGIVNKRTAEPDKDRTKSINIFAEVILKEENQRNLNRIYQHMILSEENDNSIDAKIKEAFSINRNGSSEDQMERINAYVRGGLEIIDEYFSKCSDYESVCNAIYDLLDSVSVFNEE